MSGISVVVLFILLGLWKQPVSCVIDLTHTAKDRFTAPYPSKEMFRFTNKFAGISDLGAFSGYYVAFNAFASSEHAGTHTDSPSHFSKGKWAIDNIPISRLSGPGAVIDISHKAKSDPDAMVTVEDIRKWESEHGQIPKGGVVLMKSGYSKYYPDEEAYYGREGGLSTEFSGMHFPGFSGEAIKFLAENRDIVGIASDTMSVDAGSPSGSNPWEVHQVMCENNIWGLENIANVDKLPPKGFILHNSPMKIGEGTGAPSRVFALTEDDLRMMLSSVGTSTSQASGLVDYSGAVPTIQPQSRGFYGLCLAISCLILNLL